MLDSYMEGLGPLFSKKEEDNFWHLRKSWATPLWLRERRKGRALPRRKSFRELLI